VRFLPSTVLIIVAGPLVGRWADRVGPRWLIVSGMLAVSASLLWQSRLSVDTGYGYLLPAFVLMGLGMGLTMSPMSTAAMNAVHRTKAGVASGTLSMSRMVGGTFGVAALGALVTAVGRSRLEETLPALSEPARERVVDALGSGAGTAGVPPEVLGAAREAFVVALGDALALSAAFALFGAIIAWWLIAPGPPAQPVAVAPPAAEAETRGERVAA